MLETIISQSSVFLKGGAVSGLSPQAAKNGDREEPATLNRETFTL